MYSWLHEVLRDGAEVVTATNRLARDLRSTHDREQAAGGRRAWRTPRILPWPAWLRTIPQRAPLSAGVPTRLEPPASAVVWERLLKAKAGERVLNAAGLVRQMQQTWQRLQDWCIPSDELAASAVNEDQGLFAAVASAYERELADRGWMDTAQLAAWAARLIADRLVPAPPVLVHAGFDRLHPAARRLLAVLEGAGCEIRSAPVANRRQSLELAIAPDADAEMRAAGAWARSRLAANPAARIAVVCASLEASAARTARLLREGAAPGWQYGERERRHAVNVSYGRRLSDYPMVAVALLWLKWAQRGLESREVSILLRSPFTGLAARDECHRLESRLRRWPDRSWTAASLARALGLRPDDAPFSNWMLRLQRVADFSRNAAESAPPAFWTARIDAFLERLGWPGDKVLDSAEFQLLHRWRELLDELSLLEAVKKRLRFAEAFARLASLATDTVFQPESGEGMVQLLGPLEAAGLEFDSVWFANLEAMQWPAAAWPMPLVSRSLQRQAEMPDAVPADTVERGRRILERIAGSATTVVLSWPASDRDAELVASPLLDDFHAKPTIDARDPDWFAAQLCDGAALRPVACDPAPPVRAGERVTGGAYTVQCQFDEPFAAFAYGRLGVRRMPAIEVGLSASLRGRVVHRALGELLLERPSLLTLRQWSTSELERRIARAVQRALRDPARHADAVLQRMLALERPRLQRLLRTFIENELLRPVFSVQDIEHALTLERHGVSLELRVDRIDRLEDGSLLIIDYKTGAVKNLLNAGGEPLEWQTVVYACALEQHIGGLLLINVDSRGIVYRGTGNDLPWKPLGAEEWCRRLRRWMRRIDEEIARIAAGDVRVNLALTAEQSRTLNVVSRAEVLKRAG